MLEIVEIWIQEKSMRVFCFLTIFVVVFVVRPFGSAQEKKKGTKIFKHKKKNVEMVAVDFYSNVFVSIFLSSRDSVYSSIFLTCFESA